jgi:regulator of sigma D
MLESCKSAKERWGGVSDIIDRWLNERQHLIVLFCTINGIHNFDRQKKSVQPNKASQLQQFCEILVDYVSAGHFEVYEHLLREAEEFKDSNLKIAQHALPRLQQLTQDCIVFNDRFATPELFSQFENTLPEELSSLGELLEERFSLEDRMIEQLHNSHKPLVN